MLHKFTLFKDKLIMTNGVEYRNTEALLLSKWRFMYGF
jgi:hypothetical protein